MVTFAQAQDSAERWVNAGVPADRHREVRVREFGLGFVAWAEDSAEEPAPDGRGRQRLVIARDSGDATLWPGLPVPEVIRRYEEAYGSAEPGPAVEPGPRRVDLEATSFLLSPPEWLQEAADRMGIPASASEQTGTGVGSRAAGQEPVPAERPDAGREPAAGRKPEAGEAAVSAADSTPADRDGAPGATPWAGTDTTGSGQDADRSVPPPMTVFDAPPVAPGGASGAGPDAGTRFLAKGSALPPTAVDTAALQDGPASESQVPPVPPMPTAPPGPPTGADVADAETSRAARGGAGVPPPPGVPGTPATSRPGGAGGYVPTQLVAQIGPDGPVGSGGPGDSGGSGGSTPPPAPAPHDDAVHHARTMLAGPAVGAAAQSGGPGVPPPPGPPGPVGKPQAPAPTPAPAPAPGTGGPSGGQPGPGDGGVHHAATMLAGPAAFPGGAGPDPVAPAPGPGPVPGPSPVAHQPAPGMPVPPASPVPGPSGHAGHRPPAGTPMVGPGYMAVLRYRAPDGSEQQLIRRSAPGTPHPEWQILHELRALNVPPQQVLELHTELESCELPGGYCARMIRESWPQVRISHTAGYGRDHAARRQGIGHLIAHQDELHQVADAPARPAPNRVPLPHPGQVQQAPPVPYEGIAHELLQAFGPQAVFRFDQRAVSRQGVPDVVAQTLVQAGLPVEIGPFFWAQVQPGRPVPTLAELAAERGVQSGPDAGSYLVIGSDFGRQLCVQYGTANIVAVPMEAPAAGQPPVEPQFVNSGLPEFVRCLALLGRMWRLRYGLNPEQAGRWTVDFQAQLAALDPAVTASPESWWAVLLEQMWDGML